MTDTVLNKLSNTLYYSTVIPVQACGYITCYKWLIFALLKIFWVKYKFMSGSCDLFVRTRYTLVCGGSLWGIAS